jgi:hypothetical protein
MKPRIFLIVLLYCTCAHAAAQHPLVGTWEMISVKGIGADKEPFFFDTTTVRETKIITPSHYMLIACDVEGDSLMFNRTMAGNVRVEKGKYIEIPKQASVEIFENVKVDFSWKLAGDIFTQSGTIVRPDGKAILLEALVFRRVTNAHVNNNNPAIGTWKQVSGYYMTSDGKKNSSFDASDKRLLIVTPTHWMRMDHKKDAFAGVTHGTYMHEGDTISTVLDFSSYPSKKGTRVKFGQQVKGNQVHITSTGVTPQGKPATFHDIFEKAE